MQRREPKLTIVEIFWCRKCEKMQLDLDKCETCSKSMEQIGFIDDGEEEEQ
jgi:predicted RNA-binding protein with PUA domain